MRLAENKKIIDLKPLRDSSIANISSEIEKMSDTELLDILIGDTSNVGKTGYPETSSIAADIIEVFGDLNSALAARPGHIGHIDGANALIAKKIKVMELVGHRMAKARLSKNPILSSWSDLLVYLRSSLAHQGVEKFRTLYLDRKNVLISDELLGTGTIDHVAVYPREVIRRALELNASALILVHNHPSGDPTPSENDIQTTYAIRDAAKVFGIALHDHLIIGKFSELSFRSEGIL